MNYHKEINDIIKYELDGLIKMKKECVGPFDTNVINKYMDIYNKLRKK